MLDRCDAGAYSGQINATKGVTIPVEIGPDADSPWSNLWDSDGTTKSMVPTIFDLLP